MAAPGRHQLAVTTRGPQEVSAAGLGPGAACTLASLQVLLAWHDRHTPLEPVDLGRRHGRRIDSSLRYLWASFSMAPLANMRSSNAKARLNPVFRHPSPRGIQTIATTLAEGCAGWQCPAPEPRRLRVPAAGAAAPIGLLAVSEKTTLLAITFGQLTDAGSAGRSPSVRGSTPLAPQDRRCREHQSFHPWRYPKAD